MKFNDAYRTVFEKRKKTILLKSPPPPFTQKKKNALGISMFLFLVQN